METETTIRKLRWPGKVLAGILLLAPYPGPSEELQGGSAKCEFSVGSGLHHYQLLQRDANNRASPQLEGTVSSPDARAIEFRVIRRAEVLEGLDWKLAGAAAKGTWKAILTGIPAGGPYDVELRTVDGAGRTLNTTSVHHILVGDLWVLAGQSNMHGRGALEGSATPHEKVVNFDLKDRWRIAEEPVGIELDPIDLAHAEFDKDGRRVRQPALITILKQGRGAGPGLAFAVNLVERTGTPVGLLPCARGATSLEKWAPTRKSEGSASLYGALLRRVAAAGGRVAGILWYQGESDAFEEGLAPQYLDRFREFVAAIRSDLGQPDLPFIYVQLGRYVGPEETRAAGIIRVRTSQWKVEKLIANSAMAPALDLEIQDSVHLDTPSLKRLSARLANLACIRLFPQLPGVRDLQIGPRPQSAVLTGQSLRVTFSGVNGRLLSVGRPSGFLIRNADGSDLRAVYHVDFAREDPSSLFITVPPKLPGDAQLWYGWGADPYCNVVDEKDMALPAFGPFAIEQKQEK
jgi:sialate O-acetylesterase